MTRVHFPAFEDGPQRHGGVKRAGQLREALTERGYVCIDLPVGRRKHLELMRRHPLRCMAIALSWLWPARARGLSFKGFLSLCSLSLVVEEAVRRHAPDLISIELSRAQSALLPAIVERLAVPYCCLPQNIEFLVPLQPYAFFRSDAHAFAWERHAYLGAAANHAISAFDASVIESLGAPATVFPFFPARPDLERFTRIARERQATARGDFYLLLGTVLNPPTRLGMERLLKAIAVDDRHRFVVVGYGTEVFASRTCAHIEVLGGIGDEALDRLLVATKAVVVLPQQTSGFLTRIVELNLCAIPMYFASRYAQAAQLEDHGIRFVADTAALGEHGVDDGAAHVRRFERPDSSVFNAPLRDPDAAQPAESGRLQRAAG